MSSRLYNMIENQVNVFMATLLQNPQTGQLEYGNVLSGPAIVRTLISLLTTIIFLVIILFFGVYLWNHGLAPVFPNVVAPLSPSMNGQSKSEYVQLVLTLLALMIIF